MNTIPNPYQDYGFDPEYALAHLLAECVVFCNTRDYLLGDLKCGRTIVLFVNCNDTFVPAADSEDITVEELQDLYDFWATDNNYGPIKWVARRRNLQPWSRARIRMKESGAWEEWMDKLGQNNL